MAEQTLLTGYKVLDFTHALAGPTATRLMAEIGAEVIKIDRLPMETQPGWYRSFSTSAALILCNITWASRGCVSISRLTLAVRSFMRSCPIWMSWWRTTALA